jgi:carboxyl-terminal processing protease
MDNRMSNAMKYALVSAIAVMLLALVFVVGFASAYLLTGSGTLPALPGLAPAAELPPTEEGTLTGVAPTPTPVPIPAPTNEDEEAFQLFWEVWGLVQQNFYGDLPDMQEVAYAAISGMLEALDDPYVAFLEPDVAARAAEDATGELQGIGAWVGMDEEEDKLVILGVFEGGPAEQAGVRGGDRVLKVDGVSIIGSSVNEAVAMIRGPAGTEVTLLIEREGVPGPFEVTVTRARVEIPVTEVEMLDDGIGYIRLYDFQTTVASDRMEAGLEELLAEEPVGIIFDLRGNGGGFLNQAVRIADLFLDDGVVVTERRSDGSENNFEARPGDIAEDIPLVVLVDSGSASASEIVAGALQDRERAILVGETTFGKGAVQLVFNLSDGSELWVPAARWFTPNDRGIHGEGLTPDIEALWPEELEPDADPQLERAVEYLLTGE